MKCLANKYNPAEKQKISSIQFKIDIKKILLSQAKTQNDTEKIEKYTNEIEELNKQIDEIGNNMRGRLMK